MLKEFVKNKDEIKNALLGTIIADGHITQERERSYKDKTYLEITHTSKNLDYLKEISLLFDELGISSKISEYNKRTTQKEYFLYRLSTRSDEWLASIRSEIYINKIKTFPKTVMERFNDLSLLLLYLDDGTLKVRYYEGTSKMREARITFCLNSFTLKELITFKNYLMEKWGIQTKYYKHTKDMKDDRGFVLWTNTCNTKKFMSVIDKFYNQIPSMNYKFLKFYSL